RVIPRDKSRGMRRQAERDTLLIRKVTSWLGKAPSRPAHFKTACPRCAFPDQKHRTSNIEHRTLLRQGYGAASIEGRVESGRTCRRRGSNPHDLAITGF